MFLFRKTQPLQFPLLIFTILILTHHSHSAPAYTTLVYKGCAKQPLSDPTNLYPQTLASLFGALIPQSSKSKFAKATTGAGISSVSGLFQCRGDLAPADCRACVSRIPPLMEKLCGKVIAARVQLLGCYMLYEGAGFVQMSGMEMLYRSCSGRTAAGFEDKRDAALNAVAAGVGNGGGFFTASFEDVYAMGQCEGDVGASDCVECVKIAAKRAETECGGAIAAQIYLYRCFIAYSYYPNGAPKRGSSSSPPSSSSSGPDTGKTVAIILGGAAGIGFFVICLLFARGLIKKKDDY